MKILIISHNTFSPTNNVGKTLKNWFYETDVELSNFYIRTLEDEDHDGLNSFLCYTDFDALKVSFFGEKSILNKTSAEKKDKKSKINDKKVFSKNRIKIKHTIRNKIWDYSGLKKTIVEWMSEVEPDVIFFVPGYASFLFDIAVEAHKKLNVPIYTYFFDDYLNYNASIISRKIYNDRLNNSIENICKISSKVGFISKGMEDKYKNIFHLESTETLMTPSSVNNAKTTLKHNEPFLTDNSMPLRVFFIGNVSVGRIETLELVGKAITELKSEGFSIDYRVYSFNLSKKEIEKINYESNQFYKGSLTEKEVEEITLIADVLLHVESFHEKYIVEVKHSFSTKLADYLASDASILAIGPKTLFSMSYLKNSEAALTVNNNNVNNIKFAIKKLNDSHFRNTLASNGKLLASKNHCALTNRKKLISSLERVSSVKE